MIHDYFSAKGIPVTNASNISSFPPELKPDIIFLFEAYDYCFYEPFDEGILDELLFYVPYGFNTSMESYAYNGLGNMAAIYNFYENEYMGGLAAALSDNRGKNIYISGQPLADTFLYPETPFSQAWKDCGPGVKRVIWAPHWTITPELCWYASGTFLRTAEAMLDFAKEYEGRIQFAFKPHPLLYLTLCGHPAWGKERVDEYYRQWAEMPNSQLEEGDYAALFMQSDAMIHDCSSFRLEYLWADKPCMYLTDEQAHEEHNRMSEDALSCYQIGVEREEIRSFLEHCVLGGEDPLAQRRAAVRKQYLVPPHGKSAAQNIVDALLAIGREI